MNGGQWLDVSIGSTKGCEIMMDQRAFCWGFDAPDAPISLKMNSTVPVEVPGGLKWGVKAASLSEQSLPPLSSPPAEQENAGKVKKVK